MCKATSESWPLRRMGAAKSVLSGHRETAIQGKESSDDSEDLASEKKHAFEPCHPTTRPLAGQQPTAARHERAQSSVTSLHAVYEEVLELQSAAPTLEPSALLLRRTAAAAVMPNLAPTTGEEKPAVFKVSPVSVIERGHGVHTSPDGQRYEGEWRDSKAHGQGEHTWPNGERYAGEFAEDTMSGRGVHTWSDGERYEGEFLDDLMHGRGSYTWITGKHYQGDFFEDKMHGRGECTWPSGQHGTTRTTYEGSGATPTARTFFYLGIKKIVKIIEFHICTRLRTTSAAQPPQGTTSPPSPTAPRLHSQRVRLGDFF